MSHYCYLCGSALNFQIVEGRDREMCSHCGWILYEHRKVSAGVRIIKDGRLLLVQRGIEPWKNAWHMPAGYLEVDEDPRECAKRETLEETGFEVEVGDLVGIYTYEDDPRGNGIVLLYEGEIIGGVARPNRETLAVRFFAPGELAGITCSGASGKQQIEDWLKLVVPEKVGV